MSGSPHYLAPERAAGGPPSVSSDIYALGVLGYLLLTGTLPFDGGVVEVLMAQIHDPVDPMAARRGEELDEAIENLVRRAMAKDPAQRHGSAAAFRYELNTVMDMLDMGRRRSARGSGMMETAGGREVAVQTAFERSRIPQALLSIEGTMVASNRAFNKLASMDEKGVEGLPVTELSIATYVPGLLRALRTVHTEGRPSERRAARRSTAARRRRRSSS